MTGKRVVSLLPGATETVAAVGALSQLVGVSHECDWPPAVRSLPRVTTTPIDVNAPSAVIDRTVREAVAQGRAVIAVDAAMLRRVNPGLIITQALCDVCAVIDGQVHQLARLLDPVPDVLALQATTLDGVWRDIVAVGAATGHRQAGLDVAASLAARVRQLSAPAPARRPRVVVIEWLEPLFLAGHWVPEMVAAAGGLDVGSDPGQHSVVRSWPDVMALDPELVIIALCGFDQARAEREVAGIGDPAVRSWLAARRVAIIDGNAYTSRPGPRLVEGIGRMRQAMESCVVSQQS
jgi:iron complex transport system substrate-binding protein